jgi:hypothetical protein
VTVSLGKVSILPERSIEKGKASEEYMQQLKEAHSFI